MYMSDLHCVLRINLPDQIQILNKRLGKKSGQGYQKRARGRVRASELSKEQNVIYLLK